MESKRSIPKKDFCYILQFSIPGRCKPTIQTDLKLRTVPTVQEKEFPSSGDGGNPFFWGFLRHISCECCIFQIMIVYFISDGMIMNTTSLRMRLFIGTIILKNDKGGRRQDRNKNWDCPLWWTEANILQYRINLEDERKHTSRPAGANENTNVFDTEELQRPPALKFLIFFSKKEKKRIDIPF